MAETLILYDNFLLELFKGVFDLETHSIKAILCTSSYTPDSAAHTALGDITNQLSTGNGYTQNSNVVANIAITVDAGVVTIDCDNIEWEASGGAIGPARYLVLYDDDAADKLIGYADFAANRTAADGSFFRLRIHADGLINAQQVA